MNRAALVARSLFFGAVGGGVAAWLELPLAWMMGSLIFCMILSLGGVEISLPKSLKKSVRMMVGLILGAAVTPTALSRIHEWPMSLMLLVLGIVLMVLCSTLYYQKIAKFDRLTAFSASIPGAISSIPVLAIAIGADPKKMVLPHLFRITLIILIIPPLYSVWQGASTDGLAMAGQPGIDWLGNYLWLVPLAPLAWYLGKLMRFPIPELTATMMLSAGLSLNGFTIVLPDWLFALTFVVIGSSIGGRFYKMPLSLLIGTGRHALTGNMITLLTTAVIAWVIHFLTGVPLPVALLAVVPGGIAEMAILAAVLGVDPVFVTIHQVMRSLLISATAPFLLAQVKKRMPQQN